MTAARVVCETALKNKVYADQSVAMPHLEFEAVDCPPSFRCRYLNAIDWEVWRASERTEYVRANARLGTGELKAVVKHDFEYRYRHPDGIFYRRNGQAVVVVLAPRRIARTADGGTVEKDWRWIVVLCDVETFNGQSTTQREAWERLMGERWKGRRATRMLLCASERLASVYQAHEGILAVNDAQKWLWELEQYDEYLTNMPADDGPARVQELAFSPESFDQFTVDDMAERHSAARLILAYEEM